MGHRELFCLAFSLFQNVLELIVYFIFNVKCSLGDDCVVDVRLFVKRQDTGECICYIKIKGIVILFIVFISQIIFDF